MKKWIRTSDGQTETYINTAAIISIEYHKTEGYMRLFLSDGKATIWRPYTDEQKKDMEEFYNNFLIYIDRSNGKKK